MKTAHPYIYRDKVGRWVLDCRVGGRRQRRFFHSEAKAKAALADINRDIRDAGRDWIALDHAQRLELIDLRRKCIDAGISPWRLWEHWVSIKGATASAMTISQAIVGLLKSKRAAARRPKYITQVESFLCMWATGQEHRRLADVTTEEIREYVAGLKVAPLTVATRITILSTLFSWAVKEGHIQVNPVDRVERPTIDHQSPKIFSVPDCERMLRWTRKNAPAHLGWLVLALFAGIRPNEIERLDAAAVDLDRGIVTISAAASKVHLRRIVDLSANAVEWLRVRPFTPQTFRAARWYRERMVSALKLEWHQDGLRHTAASMMLARDQDAARVALQLGNSPAILLRHYRELVRKEDAVEFWAIAPERA